MPKIIITESGTEPMRGALRAAASRLASRTASASGHTRGAATASTSAPSSPSDPYLDDVPADVSTLEPGATFTRTRAFTAHDVASFASITGDHNPIHVNSDAARTAGFEHGPVVHGMLCASMFGAIIGTKFPGAVYATQSLAFRKPVRVNEPVRAEVEVTKVRGGRVQFATRVVKEDGGDVALDGAAMAMIRRS